MTNCIFDNTTKLFVGGSSGEIPLNATTQSLVVLPDFPDKRNTRLTDTNDGVRQATSIELDDFDRPPKVLEVKAEAQKRILNLVADWSKSNYKVKQLNTLMLAISECYNALVAIQAGDTAARDAAITNMGPMKTLADTIKAIRDASNTIEADIVTATDVINYDVSNSVTWP